MSTLRLLLPGNAQLGDLVKAPADALQAVADLYAYPNPVPEGGWVRATMVSTVDGAASGADHLSRSISNPADRTIFSALRGLADVVVVGAGTARAEAYLLPEAKPDFAERRGAAGQQPAPALAVVTRSGDVSGIVLGSRGRLDAGLFHIITCASADVAGLRRRFGDAVLVAGEDRVEPALAVAHLAARGLGRILLEGGPSLLGTFLDAERLDELCMTISPLAVAGQAPRIAHSTDEHPAWARLRLTHLIECDGSLLGRWQVHRG